jgi:hypothetical protein
MFRPMPAFLLAVLLAPAAYAAETQCQNRADDDGDGVVDCADADCFSAKECQPGGGEENTDLACSDFVDNDNDTLIDCDDPDCEGRNVKACRGSWQRDEDGPARPAAPAQGTPGKAVDVDAMIGADGDLDGERTNDVCADGMDNDGDGRTDCEDYGCRYDPAVTVCQPNAGSRFSVVVGVQQSHLAKSVAGVVTTQDTTGLDRLQLRALGSIPTVSNSFYMISIRAERAIRTTFALFQIPLGTHGHYVNVNTGSGGLSSALVVSAANQLFLDPAAYVYRAFEQGNGAAAEVGGPLVGNKVRYRAFLAGGSGKSTGNVGGSFFSTSDRNFNWSAGGQLQFNLVGSFSRLDSPFLYTPVPLTVGVLAGAKFDQRDDERYPAANALFLLRYNRFILQAENYSKYELNFGSFQTAYVVQGGFLVIPKRVIVAAEFGQFVAQPFATPNDVLQKPLDEWQFRAAAHLFVWRNIGIASLIFRERHQAPRQGVSQQTIEREVFGELQFRF